MFLMAASATNSKPPQDGPKLANKELVSQFFQAARQQEQLEAKFVQGCPSARKAIIFYRSRTWEHQDMQGKTRHPTYYPERKRQACQYKKFVAKKWSKRSRVERKQLERLMSSNYGFAKVVVNATFPVTTRKAALSVVGCETGSTYSRYAHNSTTDVRGLFQIDSGNGGRIFYYNRERLVLNSSRLYDPWYNAKVALFMTNGGKDWDEWHCQPFVGIG